MSKKPILLAPVGSFEALHAAIQGGADAIYFGVEQLNMRTKSVPNITLDDIEEIATLCKKNGVRSYLTLNTVVYDHDLVLAQQIVKSCKEKGIDAIIASDFAVFELCKRFGMPLHISTQANVSNIEAVTFFAQFADVIVLARELTLSQVAKITQEIKRRKLCGPSGELVQIECFVHGALCMAVSGKCYLSLHEKNASANRGACVQNCRRPYEVIDKETGNVLEIDNEYIMSPKDLCTIDFVDQLMQAGVDVFKIEGRGKSADYVFTTTQCYQEAIQSVHDNTYTSEKIQVWQERLSSVYNRGFWEGYFMGKKLGEWTNKHPGSVATEKKIYIARGTKYYPKLEVAEFEIETGQLKKGDTIMVIGRDTGYDKIHLDALFVNGNESENAGKGDRITFKFNKAIKKNDKLYKVVTDNA